MVLKTNRDNTNTTMLTGMGKFRAFMSSVSTVGSGCGRRLSDRNVT